MQIRLTTSDSSKSNLAEDLHIRRNNLYTYVGVFMYLPPAYAGANWYVYVFTAGVRRRTSE